MFKRHFLIEKTTGLASSASVVKFKKKSVFQSTMATNTSVKSKTKSWSSSKTTKKDRLGKIKKDLTILKSKSKSLTIQKATMTKIDYSGTPKDPSFF